MKLKATIVSLLVLITTIATGLFGCSTASVRVMPGEAGLHRVTARDIEKSDAEEAAVEAAEEYCEDQKKRAVFVKEGTSYTGTMDEKTRDNVRKASQAATILGSGVGAADEPVAGGAVGAAGVVGNSMTSGKDYLSEVQFKCQ